MRIFPLVVFAAAAGVGSGLASFKYTSQLNYDNAMLTLRVQLAERRIAELRKQRPPLSSEAAVPARAPSHSEGAGEGDADRAAKLRTADREPRR